MKKANVFCKQISLLLQEQPPPAMSGFRITPRAVSQITNSQRFAAMCERAQFPTAARTDVVITNIKDGS